MVIVFVQALGTVQKMFERDDNCASEMDIIVVRFVVTLHEF